MLGFPRARVVVEEGKQTSEFLSHFMLVIRKLQEWQGAEKEEKKNFQGFSVSLVCVKLVVPSLMLLSLAPSRCKSLRWGGVVNAWRLLIKNAHFFTLVELPRLARFVGSQWRPLSSSWMKWELQKNTTKLSPSNLRGRHEAANDSLEEEAKREKLQHQRNGIRKITNACSEFSRLLLLLGPETLYDVILLLCKREEITEEIETNFFLAESSWRKMTEIFSDDEDKKKKKRSKSHFKEINVFLTFESCLRTNQEDLRRITGSESGRREIRVSLSQAEIPKDGLSSLWTLFLERNETHQGNRNGEARAKKSTK